MSINVVVAHYKENIKWLNNIIFNDSRVKNIYLYSKDPYYVLNTELKNNKKIIHSFLPNVGRESHTYLTYCVENYNADVDSVFFLQGNPRAHGVNLERIKHWIDRTKNNINFISKNFSIASPFKGLKNKRIYRWQGPTEPCELPMDLWFKSNIQPKLHHPSKIYFGANFCMPSSKIRTRTRAEYLILIQNYFLTKNPEACHFMERSWYYWFNL
jgi:hypothetical protein